MPVNAFYVGTGQLVFAIGMLLTLCGTLIGALWQQLKTANIEEKKRNAAAIKACEDRTDAMISRLEAEVRKLMAFGNRFEIYVRDVEDLEVLYKELNADVKRLAREIRAKH